MPIGRPGHTGVSGAGLAAGAPVCRTTEQRCVNQVMESLLSGRGGWIVTLNLDHLRRCASDPDYATLVLDADSRVADGMPLVWASWLRGTPLPGRVAGSDLVLSLSRAFGERGMSVYLLGGNPGTAEAAVPVLRRACPGLVIAGTACPAPGFENDPRQMEKLRKDLEAAAPHVVLVALGSPKQERLIRLMKPCVVRAWWVGGRHQLQLRMWRGEASTPLDAALRPGVGSPAGPRTPASGRPIPVPRPALRRKTVAQRIVQRIVSAMNGSDMEGTDSLALAAPAASAECPEDVALAAVPGRAETHRLVIEPRRGWIPVDWKEMVGFRELLCFLIWRDVKVRYKQTVLGVAWAVLQPVLTMVICTMIFGRFAGIPSDGSPYAVFVYAGLLPWTFFSNSVSQGGLSLVNQQHLLTKVYLPRLFVPAASVGVRTAGPGYLVWRLCRSAHVLSSDPRLGGDLPARPGPADRVGGFGAVVLIGCVDGKLSRFPLCRAVHDADPDVLEPGRLFVDPDSQAVSVVGCPQSDGRNHRWLSGGHSGARLI